MVCLKKWLRSEILQYVLCYFQLSKILLLEVSIMFNYVLNLENSLSSCRLRYKLQCWKYLQFELLRAWPGVAQKYLVSLKYSPSLLLSFIGIFPMINCPALTLYHFFLISLQAFSLAFYWDLWINYSGKLFSCRTEVANTNNSNS